VDGLDAGNFRDVDKAAEFYKNTFDFNENVQERAKGDDGSTWHTSMQYKDQVLMLDKEGAYGGQTKSPATSGTDAPISMYLYVDNVDTFYKSAVSKGAESMSEPQDMFWGDRMCQIKDTDGYVWSFATYLGE